MSRSVAERLADLPVEVREELLAHAGLTDLEARALSRSWRFVARPEQVPSLDDVDLVAFVTGRGFGKTASAAHLYHQRIQWLSRLPRRKRRYVGRGGIVHRTGGEVREVCVEGEDGLIATSPRGMRPRYEPSKRRLTWPSGFVATTFSADEPDQLRGPTLGLSWGEEFASWRGERDATGSTAYDNLRYAMRGGVRQGVTPLTILTTTPKRTAAMRELEQRAATSDRVRIVRGSLLDNARNLPRSFVEDIVGKYAGTSLGAQEIFGELARDVAGSSFKSGWFDDSRVTEDELPNLGKIIVAVDPSVGDGTGDECGIAVLGLSAGPMPDGRIHLYVLDDATISGAPDVWAREIDDVCRFWQTVEVVVEANQGGRMAGTVLRNVNATLRVREVHATAGKTTRAEPAAALFARGQAHIVDELPELEAQCCTWTPSDRYSPDRMDAMVHGVNYLMPRLTGRTHTVLNLEQFRQRI